MPLVVSSLTGDASDVFDWTRSVSPGGAQDLSELLQMLREHYCGSFTFWEQRNMVENLHQGAREDAHNRCLEGKSASPHVDHQRAAAQTSGYKPRFHKTTTFATSVEESADPAVSEQGSSLPEDNDHLGGEPIQEEDEGLYIPSFLEEALGGDGNLQIKMACTMQAQE